MKGSIKKWLDEHIGRLTRVKTEQIHPAQAFADIAAVFADMPGTVALMSGGGSDSARFHLLAVKPWLTVKAYGRRLEVSTDDCSMRFDVDPFEALQLILDHFAVSEKNIELPVISGLFGYFSYDLKDYIENLPRTAVNDLSLPHICLYVPSLILIRDRWEEITWQCIPQLNGRDFLTFDDWVRQGGCGAESLAPGAAFSFRSSGDLRAGLAKPSYLAAIDVIKEYIVSGHIYQANFAQRFETDFYGSPFALFRTLFDAAPAPFYAYIQAGDHHIVSTSPERLVRQTGKNIETRPIKGTRPRGNTEKEDQSLRTALLQSAKDDAELSMIVDLLRNDFGRVCRVDSVHVAEHKRLEAYVNVFHLVSIIKGRLRANMGSVDLIKAIFPGGSITGCPRIRAMEIIDEIEPCQRHIYTGSIGYISFHRTMDLSIAIRTATIVGDRLLFSVGGGIVFDSDAEDEYQETLHKGRSLINVLEAEGKKGQGKNYVWRNGRLEPIETAKVPLSDLGVQYGFGFFETIRVANGTPEFLAAHIHRFNHSWKHLFKKPTPDVTWADIISQVIKKNGLSETIAAVKLIATRGSREHPPYDHQLIVTARAYTQRPAISERGGLALATYPHPRQSPLADYKTLNYLYYYLAGKWAKESGADEALVLNPDGSVSETNTANILMVKRDTVYSPTSPHVLGGVMEKQVIACLRRMGYEIKAQRLMPAELFSADAVILANSLIGAVPVIALDNEWLCFNQYLCQNLCRYVQQGNGTNQDLTI